MNEFLTNTLEINNFLESDLVFDRDHLLKKVRQTPIRLRARKVFNLNREIESKDLTKVSSLERIRIVVDSLLGDEDIYEICRREGISQKTYLQWKSDFIEAFNKHSEDVLVQEKLTSTTKEIILKEANEKVFNFFKNFIDVNSGKNLIIPKGEKLSTYSTFNRIENIIILNKINNFRQINKHLEEVNGKLANGGFLMGCFETFNARSQRQYINNIPILNKIYSGFDFIFNRVFPKLPFFKKIYFHVTKGKNRLLSKAEALGRLVSCGFDIIDYKMIDGIHYFSAMKIKEPAFDMNPSYGPLFKMKRVGKNGKIIGVYKFRTMHPYSEYLQDYVLKLNGYAKTGKPANDFRLVPYAKLIRRFWLDEIPQLINLFKGELKLVGCRPVSQRYFQDIPKELQDLRLKQKPGCIPPYVALNHISTVDGVLQAEKEYLMKKWRIHILQILNISLKLLLIFYLKEKEALKLK